MLLLLNLSDSLYRQSCHVRTKRVLFLPSQSVYLLFPFLVLLQVRASKMMLKRSGEKEHPSLVPDLSGKASSLLPFMYNIKYNFLQMFFTKLRKFPSISSLLRGFFFLCHEWVFHCVKYFRLIYWNGYVIFLPWLVHVMDYINWFSNVEPASHTLGESLLVMVYNSFYILLD